MKKPEYESQLEHDGECAGQWLLVRTKGVESWLCSACGRRALATLMTCGAVLRESKLNSLLDRLASEGAELLWREHDGS